MRRSLPRIGKKLANGWDGRTTNEGTKRSRARARRRGRVRTDPFRLNRCPLPPEHRDEPRRKQRV
jgi:hypothetical protein